MRRYVIFACAGISLLMHAMDVTMVAVALPDLMKEFSANVLWVGWVVSIYLVAVPGIMPLMGTLSDNLGRRVQDCLHLLRAGTSLDDPSRFSYACRKDERGP